MTVNWPFRYSASVRIADVNSVDPAMAGRRGTIADIDWKGLYWLSVGADELAGPYRQDELESA